MTEPTSLADAARDLVQRTRVDRGLPATIDDPVILWKIGNILSNVERIASDTARAQGLPEHVEDPAALARIAAIIDAPHRIGCDCQPCNIANKRAVLRSGVRRG